MNGGRSSETLYCEGFSMSVMLMETDSLSLSKTALGRFGDTEPDALDA